MKEINYHEEIARALESPGFRQYILTAIAASDLLDEWEGAQARLKYQEEEIGILLALVEKMRTPPVQPPPPAWTVIA